MISVGCNRDRASLREANSEYRRRTSRSYREVSAHLWMDIVNVLQFV
jgi:hypothetical protein